MKKMSGNNSVNIDPQVGFRTCNNILNKWGCSTCQKAAILGITEKDVETYHNEKNSPSLTHEQVKRLSYILNVHFSLKSMFSNPENIDGFMTMENNNPYFNGRTPLSLIETGELVALSELALRLNNIGRPS